MTNVVIGAGLTGLTLAEQLGKCIVIERYYKSGGSASSIRKNDYVFDRGIHVINNYSKDVKMAAKLECINRIAKIYIDKNTLVDYPYQMNGTDNGQHQESDNYAEYLTQRFGDDAEKFHTPYNIKFWKTPLEKIGTEWVNKPYFPKGKGANDKFYYPKNGGIGMIALRKFKRVNEKSGIKFMFKNEVTEIDTNSKTIELSSGIKIRYSKIYNTAPLSTIRMNCPQEVQVAINRLKNTSMYIQTMSIDKNRLDSKYKDVHWLYFHQKDIPFVRISFPSNWCKGVSPDNKVLIQCESPKYITADIPDVLCELGITNGKAKVLHKDFNKFAYCIPTKNRKQCMNTINEWCEKNNIYNRGRFGRWENMWIHECLNEKI
jgi:protoporphyrinogen oxidase